MKSKIINYVIGILVGVIVAGLPLGLKIREQNKVIKEKQEEIQKLQDEMSKAGEELKKQLEYAREQIKKQTDYLVQPDLPIRATSRNAFTTGTKVLQLTNFSNSAIRVNVSCNFGGQTQLRAIDLPPNRIYELGQREGFPFKSGDSVTIEATGYRKMIKNFP